MEKNIGTQDNLFQLIPIDKRSGSISAPITIGRYLVGRTEACDIVISVGGVSAVHAVLEVTHHGVKIYDMNSKNGTTVNGNKVVVKDVALDSRISFGKVEFILKKYSREQEVPPRLPSLDPVAGSASVLKNQLPKAPHLPKERPTITEDLPYIVYPLAADPNSAYSEYIFEDTQNLYPIFKYDVRRQALEVIILFRDKVYSVDYLPEVDGIYHMAGSTHKQSEVEFPYLAAHESVPFVEVKSGNCMVHQLHNYDILHLVDKEVKKSSQKEVNLQDHEIVKLSNGDLEIFVRKVSSPPIVKSPPFFRRDKDLRKYLWCILLLIFIPLVGLNFYEVDEDIKDDKDPERIATILYKQRLVVNKNKAVESTKKRPVKKQVAPVRPAVKKLLKKETQTTSQKTPKKVTKVVKTPGAKKAKIQQKVKAVKRPAQKVKNQTKISKTVKNAKSSKLIRTARRANTNSKSKGRVETYKSFDFKSTVNTLIAKGGQIKGAKTAKTSSNSLTNSNISGGVSTNVSKANIGTEVGNLTGSTEGKLAETRGTKGLSVKSGAYTAGIPSETVVLGSMDPDVIRRILRDNIPFFRSCYQKELNRNAGKDISGTIKLDFAIGASGHVSRAAVVGKTQLRSRVKKCVVGVLKGIKFPRPLGGGTVDVKQPFNFYPKKL